MWFIFGILLILAALALNAGVVGEPVETQPLAHWMFWIGMIIFIVPLLFMLGVFGILVGVVRD